MQNVLGLEENMNRKYKFKKGDFVKTRMNGIGRIFRILDNRIMLIAVPVGSGRTFYMGGLIYYSDDVQRLATKSEIEKYNAEIMARSL
jgi:hypothetical protein